MTTFVTVANTEIDQDSPVTQPLMTALRDNPIAIAEGTTGSPVVAAGWHPYDMTTAGTGTGEIYSFSTDGALASVTTPDFEDGYEYAFFARAIDTSSAGRALVVEYYRETSGSYATVYTSTGLAGSGDRCSFWLECPAPRLNGRAWLLRGVIGFDSTSREAVNAVISSSTSQKLLRARFSFTLGNINSGTIIFYRRRLY